MNSIRQNFLIGLSKFGDFLLQGRREAAIAAMLTAAIPFMGWLSLAIVAFITLRKGAKNGLFVAGWSIVPAVISSYLMSNSLAITMEALFSYLLVWGLALLLRATASWRYVLEVSFGVCLVIIVFFYWLIPDLNQVYTQYLLDVYKAAGTSPETYTDAQEFIKEIVYYLLGVQTSLYMLHILFALVVGRGLQAVLFNPGGLSQELKIIRLDVGVLILAIIFLGFGLKMSYDWAFGAVPVFVMLYLIAGLSLVHHAIKQRIPFKGAILLFYIVCALLFPFSLIPVIVLAIGDTILNLRRFI
jgi:hypothetical protein